MSHTTRLLWLAVMMLALIWTLQLTDAVSQGLTLGMWPPVLLVLAAAGAVCHMLVVPFLSRTRTAHGATGIDGTSPAPILADLDPPAGGRVTRAMKQRAARETHDRPTPQR